MVAIMNFSKKINWIVNLCELTQIFTIEIVTNKYNMNEIKKKYYAIRTFPES